VREGQATRGLAQLGLGVPDDLEVIALNNFSLPLTTHVPVRQLGFDARETMAACLAALRDLRAGKPVPDVIHLSPRFEDEIENVAIPEMRSNQPQA